MRMKALLAGTAVAALAAGCGGSSGGSGPVALRMAWGVPGDEIKYVMQALPAAAPNQGRCYRPVWKQLTNTAQGAQELAAGTLDGATVGALAVGAAVEKGAGMVVAGEMFAERKPNFTTTWLVRKDGPVRSAADLRGRKVATAGIGTPTYYVQVRYLQERAGLRAGKDYQNPELPYAQQEEALASGRVDAGVFAQPFYAKAMATGRFRPLFQVADVHDNMPQLLQVFNRRFVKAHPEAARCFMKDFAAVARYVADPAHRDAVIAAEAKIAKIPAGALRGYLMTRQDYHRPAGGAVDVAALQATWDFFQGAGVLHEKLDAAAQTDPSLTLRDGA
ncbi:ABC transporter substrate-binding protein [Actinomadura parmotrematis]|uniref:ABC transporter substrate-binding protein n=1 Tax=Actinomadura parmotrematis TaxID=2864039 RepID=A0ABS7FZI4_9ACTN|nr:ABC transporter substrate-binding protein [Actinomadura parmotrematis]MBW8485872.1 ABC transporter substrate-binding protein [Actinomadura parmotrematis]